MERKEHPVTVEQLIQMQRAQPFRPYRIHMADGRHLDVEHPDFVARSPSGRTIVVYQQDESFEIVDLLLVSSLQVLNGGRG
jgi:hypothetical protein